VTNSKQDKPGSRPQAMGSAAERNEKTSSTGGGEYAGGDRADNQADVQGEGNYDAAREYDDAQREFANSGRVERAARDAAPRSSDEARQMEQAEREGKSHSKGEDQDDEMKR
jgi:hypothetical protein